MKLIVSNQNLTIVEIPIEDFRIELVDKRKKDCGTNYCNAGFFAGYNEGKDYFTLPVGHLLCDYKTDNKWVKHYCEERGRFLSNNKFIFDCSKFNYQNPLYQHSVSTFIIENNQAIIKETKTCPDNAKYAITGVPVIRDGKAVDFKTFVKSQGWDSSTLYATKHIFIGLKKGIQDLVYIICIKTTKSNLISSLEVFNKLSVYKFYDVIKLDGGGSTYLNVNGKTISTNENRQINNIIRFDSVAISNIKNDNQIVSNEKCPFNEPVLVIRNGSKGTGAKWVQWYLNKLGFKGRDGKDLIIDGNIGPNSVYSIIQFQKSNWPNNASQWDGKCGINTRKALKERYNNL